MLRTITVLLLIALVVAAVGCGGGSNALSRVNTGGGSTTLPVTPTLLLTPTLQAQSRSFHPAKLCALEGSDNSVAGTTLWAIRRHLELAGGRTGRQHHCRRTVYRAQHNRHLSLSRHLDCPPQHQFYSSGDGCACRLCFYC
jgi:hypothetical protein